MTLSLPAGFQSVIVKIEKKAAQLIFSMSSLLVNL